jgi:hypothetical protein
VRVKTKMIKLKSTKNHELLRNIIIIAFLFSCTLSVIQAKDLPRTQKRMPAKTFQHREFNLLSHDHQQVPHTSDNCKNIAMHQKINNFVTKSKKV